MAQPRDLSYRFGGWRADVRGTSWVPLHPAFSFTLWCPETWSWVNVSLLREEEEGKMVR